MAANDNIGISNSTGTASRMCIFTRYIRINVRNAN